MDRRAWRATVHGIPKSWTRMSDQAQQCEESQKGLFQMKNAVL